MRTEILDKLPKIFGQKTKEDWIKIRDEIIVNPEEVKNWEEATKLLEARIKTRYFSPIYNLIEMSNFKSTKTVEADDSVLALSGEGFAIMTLICSLIEFLQSCYEGKEYDYGSSRKDDTDFIYGQSGKMFKRFLRQQKPFRDIFIKPVSVPNHIKDFADDFYSNVRNGLLHEAATKDTWRIKVGNSIKNYGDIELISNDFVDINDETNKIIKRNNFFGAIYNYFREYKNKIIENKEEQINDGRGNRTLNLRDGFCRKLDLLCNMPDLERNNGKWWQP